MNVFIPKVPNPTTGFLLFVPRTQLRQLDMSVEDAIKMAQAGANRIGASASVAIVTSGGDAKGKGY